MRYSNSLLNRGKNLPANELQCNPGSGLYILNMLSRNIKLKECAESGESDTGVCFQAGRGGQSVQL